MELLIILILILLNGIFAMSEIAIVSARKAKLEIEAKKGDEKAQLALNIADSPDRFLSTVQIGITLIGILNGVFGGASITSDIKELLNNYAFLRPYSNSIAVGSVVLLITYFSLVLGELLPKRIGLAYAENIARIMAKPMNLLSRITAPFIWLLSSTSNLILKILRIKTDKGEPVTEAEIRAMVEAGSSNGSIEEIEHDIVERVFELGDRKIGSLMTPRQQIVWLDIDDDFAAIKNKVIENKHSIFLVCEKQIDKVIGIVNVKDLFPLYLQSVNIHLKELTRDVLIIPETSKAYDLLQKFQDTKIHFAAIVDEYGVLVGIVTINDIINAIVGGISLTDEFDYLVNQREDGTYLIDGQLPFEDFIAQMKIEDFKRDASGEFHTLAGFILGIINHIPKAGDVFDWNDYRFEIIDMDGNRIDKMLVTKVNNMVEEV